MTQAEITRELTKIIAAIVELHGSEDVEINAQTGLFSSPHGNCLDFGSHDVVDLVMGVEDEFGVEVSDDDVERWKTVGAVIATIGEKVGK